MRDGVRGRFSKIALFTAILALLVKVVVYATLYCVIGMNLRNVPAITCN